MDALFAVDRFEGDLAVLLDDADAELIVPRELLPQGVREGSVIRAPIGEEGPEWNGAVLDEAERHRRDVEARDRLRRLRRRDPGGDIQL